ncbi:DUF2079 domain-containing protein [Polynucleobacter paneuropaeus]|nr:DUF2079 domain-containing protein [Polynucleobacter paneuropaeus]
MLSYLNKKESIIFLIVCLILILESISRYYSLSSNYFDFGIFQTNFYNVVKHPEIIFAFHFQPLLFLWGKIYNLFPLNIAPAIILLEQSAAIIFGIYLIRRNYGKYVGWVLLLYYPLWANALLDFHFDHLAIPILAAFFIAVKNNKIGLALCISLLLLLIKESFSFQVITCCIYLIFYSSNQRREFFIVKKNALYALIGILVSGIYFYIFYFFISPNYSITGNYHIIDNGPYTWLFHINNPYQFFEVIFNPQKIKFLIVIFGLLLFIPLINPRPLIVLLAPLVISLLAKDQPLYYSYANHYTAGMVIPIIIAFSYGNKVVVKKMLKYKLSKQTVGIYLTTVLIMISLGFSLFSSSPIGRLFWSDKVSSYSWKSYIPSMRDELIKEKISEFIPSDPKVSVATQNSLNWGILANRENYFVFPYGVIESYPSINWSNNTIDNIYVDYVIIDMNQPFFIADKGCNWVYGVCMDKSIELEFLKLVDKIQIKYNVMYESDNFYIYKKKI